MLQFDVLYFRDSSFDKKSTSSLKITTTSGQTAISGSFPIQLAMCNITYVTTDSFFVKLLIHVHNGDHDTRTIKTVSNQEHMIIPKWVVQQTLSILYRCLSMEQT